MSRPLPPVPPGLTFRQPTSHRPPIFDPGANMQAALSWIKRRHIAPWTTWPPHHWRWYVQPDWDWPGYDCDGMGV